MGNACSHMLGNPTVSRRWLRREDAGPKSSPHVAGGEAEDFVGGSVARVVFESHLIGESALDVEPVESSLAGHDEPHDLSVIGERPILDVLHSGRGGVPPDPGLDHRGRTGHEHAVLVDVRKVTEKARWSSELFKFWRASPMMSARCGGGVHGSPP